MARFAQATPDEEEEKGGALSGRGSGSGEIWERHEEMRGIASLLNLGAGLAYDLMACS
jgi:hypothetical protein